ncbi:MAG: glycosyltransferase family A protein [Phycisphaeraceae bacterium]
MILPADKRVDLLLLTHNRRQYLEKMLPQLLSDPADFRLHCWDNASTDGTADIIADLDDDRVARKHFHPENANQTEPSLWFLESAPGDIVGKIDDDILLPHGWIDRIAPMVRRNPTLGMIGCWIFMPQDWDEQLAAHNIVDADGDKIFRVTAVAGQSFLARRDLLRYYVSMEKPGFPVDGSAMSLDGYISGQPTSPLLMAHNMDDPRSPHCLMATEHADGDQQAFTMRRQPFKSLEDYARWIAADARRRQTIPIHEQLQNSRRRRRQERSVVGRFRHKMSHLLRRP